MNNGGLEGRKGGRLEKEGSREKQEWVGLIRSSAINTPKKYTFKPLGNSTSYHDLYNVINSCGLSLAKFVTLQI